MKPTPAAEQANVENVVPFDERRATSGAATAPRSNPAPTGEAEAALEAFAKDLARALDPDAGSPRDAWVSVLVAAQKLCARRDIDQGSDAFAAMALAMRELDKGRVPLPLEPGPVGEMPSAWKHWFGR